MHNEGHKYTVPVFIDIVNESLPLCTVSNKKKLEISLTLIFQLFYSWAVELSRVLHIYTFVPPCCSICCCWVIDNSLMEWLRKSWMWAFKKGKKGEDIQREELQLLKTPAKKEERAVNVEEMRLPCWLCEYKENLLARRKGLASSCHSNWPTVL